MCIFRKVLHVSESEAETEALLFLLTDVDKIQLVSAHKLCYVWADSVARVLFLYPAIIIIFIFCIFCIFFFSFEQLLGGCREEAFTSSV